MHTTCKKIFLETTWIGTNTTEILFRIPLKTTQKMTLLLTYATLSIVKPLNDMMKTLHSRLEPILIVPFSILTSYHESAAKILQDIFKPRLLLMIYNKT